MIGCQKPARASGWALS